MSNNGSNPYPKSQMPPARSTTGIEATRQPISPISGQTLYDRTRSQQAAKSRGPIVAPDSRHVEYPSMAQYEKLVIPRHPSDMRAGNFDEVLARDFSRHVSTRVREGFRVGPDQAVSVLRHYVGYTKGAGLFDPASMADFERLSNQFTASPSEEAFKPVEQFLGALVPEARGGAE